MNLLRLIPIFDNSVSSWGLEARLLRWLTLIWMFIGLVVLFSASYPVADERHGDGLYYFKRQIIWAIVSLIIFNIIVNLPLRKILGVSHWFLIFFLMLIFITLIPGLGKKAFDAARWIAIGPIPIQPSELIKPFLVLQSATLFGQWEKRPWGIRLFWLGVFCLVLLGIIAQPNLSTTALCGMTIWFIALAAGIPYKYLGGTAVGGILLAIISISIKSYQRKRIMSFMNPWADATGDGYQLVQSLLAVGSGQTWGVGFGLSQQKLFYLPIQDTDFIFAIFSEEFGFIGGVLLLLMLAIFATLGLIIAIKSKNLTSKLVAIGVVVIMVGQSLLHIGVTTGALPTTGLPLPMFSYGGNSMISSLVSSALLIRVARESSEAEVVTLRKTQSKNRRRR
ncbi:FtsW/RodA/SpoVE family cell cycle protein [Aphanizomenon flos-aquae NRERC-008]|uniref:Probable peptidoglycan glycosyltransferase FtsW n=1 Tax=Aphanizomenon flos-aquae FACHB-1249 TaxID=2692889 RepID=A0ABR8IT96_APHFL|nr:MULTISPECIES: FtsW/RodA/SpoVE family cell cycle protein [Aphanizomenon]MBD2390966.1 FtsW/RodA/SpoVE family cell cycle protein [Aphanizomenon flos-aquae FACHB-1171]MBD2557326.1 FtsW/RodA/SpoVE family cell cycle protein [Aphanizomenon flos-aquae FACHB-1290]MBD2631914.1 FtsW/RodA/SpoVE family cell cycle protein [Aphanizomenon sp. FACHB-1399]MBD2657704.1 FtsW/RodA/SpoVE family cell cycle protein [Aphanizomenon flos-aquae FACHB-1265]MBD2672987.1 FtsW/RodA/SpoVE family cell cycle protein [Aphaniz